MIDPLIKKIPIKKIIIILFVLLASIALYLFFSKNTSKNSQADIKIVEVTPVQLKNFQQTIRLIGVIKPKRLTLLSAKLSGTVDLIATSGEKIQKGTLVAKIDHPDVEKTYELSEAAEKIAKTQYEAVAGLLKSGHASQHETQEKKTTWIEAQKTLANAKIDLDKSRFYAPFDGIVGVFKVREGAYVKEGDPIVSIYDPNSLTVVFDIPGPVIHSIQNHQPVRIHGIEYRLSHLQRMLDEETHMCPADVDIQCEKCVVGSTVDVDLTVQKKNQALVIPFNSVFLRQGKSFVYVVTNNKAILTPIQLGIREKEQVEVISGLKPGQAVIARGHARVYPDAPVKIHTPNQATHHP